MSWHVVIARKAAHEIEEQYHWLAQRSEAGGESLAQLAPQGHRHAGKTIPNAVPRRPKPSGTRACANSSTGNAAKSIACYSRSVGRPSLLCACGTAPRIS